MGANGSLTDTEPLRVAGLFAGIGGLERGLSQAGHETTLLCENDPAAQEVLRARFRKVDDVVGDVREIDRLPAGTTMIAAGFPCQDLSQAGGTRGISGSRSGLVREVFRLLETHDVSWLLLENVPFMLQLGRGSAMNFIVQRLEELGFSWAYRVIDARAFGKPQRRERVYLLASRVADPTPLLHATSFDPATPTDYDGRACGFYWTEGVRGLGWAVDAIPTLKGGSTVGIPSPPAIWMPDGRIVTPDIRDAERLQGFPADWTKLAELVGRSGFRWRLVGNAVSVPVAKWIGDQLARRGKPRRCPAPSGLVTRAWPRSAALIDGNASVIETTTWPVRRKQTPLQEFLKHEPKELSLRATTGFEKRLSSSTLRAPEAFRSALRKHIKRMQAQVNT